MASKKTLKSTRKRKPKSTRKRKPKRVTEILVSKGVPKLELTKAEERIIHNEQEKYVKKLMEREIDELRELLKPRLDLEKATQEAGPDSPLAQTVKDISRRPRRYAEDHLGFRAPPTARDSARRSLLAPDCDTTVMVTPPYYTGGPIPELVGDDAAGYKTSSALAIPSAGALSVAVANGQWLGTDWPSSDEWSGGDANHANAWLRHMWPCRFPGRRSMEVTIDVIVGDPRGLPMEHDVLEVGSASTRVGVKGVMFLQLAYGQGTKIRGTRSNEKPFLWKETPPWSPWSDIDLEQFSLSETLVLEPRAEWAAVCVVVLLSAFRHSVDVPRVDVPLAGFSGIELRTRDPSIPTHDIIPGHGPAGPIIIDTMCIALRPLPMSEIRA
ncbi:MAG: hypothetical protein JSU86_05925 [Phycisphaerales bacterium]|nr:MAG: hypothetical protein JSU86_05925 [Phycisphaerales bacterium]